MITDDEIVELFARNDPCAGAGVPATGRRLDAAAVRWCAATRVDLDEIDASGSDGRTRERRWPAEIAAAAAVVVSVLAVLAWVVRDDDSKPPNVSAPDSSDEVVAASGLLAALARHDAALVESLLAPRLRAPLFVPDRVAIADRSAYDLRSEIEWQEATGFELIVGSCEAVRVVDDETTVRCPYGVQWLGSADMGLGPYGGNDVEIVVRDRSIVEISNLTDLEQDGFDEQWWRPFADWVATTHPDALDTMYVDADATWARYTDESIRLWERLGEQYASPQTRVGTIGLPPASAKPSPIPTGAPTHCDSVDICSSTVSEREWCNADRTAAKLGAQCSFVLVYPNGTLVWRYHGNIPEGANPVSTGLLEQHLSPSGVESFRQGFDWPTEAADMAALLRDAAAWPAGTWDDSRIRPFVPSGYYVCFGPIHASGDVGPQLLDNLPAAARDLAQQWDWGENHHMDPAFFVYCADLTTEQARSLATALDRAGLVTTPVANAYALDYHLGDGPETGGIRLNFGPMTWQPIDRESSDAGVVAPPKPLGVFESIRGQILLTHGDGLGVVDPDDPVGEVTVLTIDSLADLSTCDPSGDCPTHVEPVGWSADGTILAFVDEHDGGSYVLDSTGAISLVASDGGCCNFTSTNWLSPDGRYAAVPGETTLRVIDLASLATVAAVDLDGARFPASPGLGQISYPTWSPDGAQVAFVVAWHSDDAWDMSIQVLDVASGSVRDLRTPTLTEFRGLAWSPDGAGVLAVAGHGRATTSTGNNPLAQPRSAGLYVLGLDASEPQLIDEGHYIAAVWSPDGSRIAAIDHPGEHQLVVMNADGTDRREIAPAASGLFNGLAWHPVP